MNTNCGMCTRHLVMIAYGRSAWFRLLREPLKLAMRAWVRLSGLDLSGYALATPACRDCNRFYKNALKDHSAVFRAINGVGNPLFDKVLERIVEPREMEAAAHRARNRDRIGPPEDPDRWTNI